jgi:phage gpG-like protein
MSALSFRITRNDIAPALSRMAAAAKRPAPIFRAMGTTFLSLTMGNFKSSDYRPTGWPAKKDGTPATLQKSGTLSRSFHLSVSNTGATVSNPMVYAAIHQFGSSDYGQASVAKVTQLANGITQIQTERRQNIPPRPFFPVANDRLTPKAEEKIRAAGERAALRQFGQK